MPQAIQSFHSRIVFFFVALALCGSVMATRARGEVAWPPRNITGIALMPEALHGADLDGDGDLDVVVAAASTILWFENDGTLNPSFIPRTIASQVAQALDLDVADLNGDGRPDVISASFEDDTIAWYENLGSAPLRFARHTLTMRAFGAVSVLAIDLDSDGDIDILAASLSDHTVRWFENDGAQMPTFTEHVITSDMEGPFAVEAADLDGDQDLDVIVADPGANKIFWFENDGQPSLGLMQRSVADSALGILDLDTEDVDGDGDIDILALSVDTGIITWFENFVDETGPPIFIPRVVGVALGGRSVFGADIDGDGDLDVLTASQDDNEIAWHENDGSTLPSFQTHIITTDARVARGVFAGDVNGDGAIDVLSVSVQDDKIAWYENDGAHPPNFPTRLISISSVRPQSVFAADLDGDADVDVLIASQNDDRIAWYENKGGTPPIFSPHIITDAADGAQSVFAIDLDGDGDIDVLSASQNDNTIAWYENDGSLPPQFEPRVIDSDALAAHSVYAGDIDNDGDIDVLSASITGDTIAWHENDGQFPPAFTTHPINTNANGASSVFAADIDGNGTLDVLSASSGDNRIILYSNNGMQPPGFKTVIITSAALLARSVFAADVDGDGDLDILSASTLDDTIAWYENRGEATPAFPKRTITTEAFRTNSIFAIDVDGDGDIDVLSASFDDLDWYENDGQPTPGFTTHNITSSATAGGGIFLADLDGDQNPDAISAASGADRVTWFKNPFSRPSFLPPDIHPLPDMIIGDKDDAPNRGFIDNHFVFPDAIDLREMFIADDDATSETVIWSYFESTGEILIDGVPSLNPSLMGLNEDDPTSPAVSKRLDLHDFDPDSTDSDRFTLTFRNQMLSPIGGPDLKPDSPVIQNVVTFYASNGSSFTAREMMVYTVDETTDRLCANLPFFPLGPDFDFTEGSTLGWSGQIPIFDPPISGTVGLDLADMTGLCMTVGGEGDFGAFWISPGRMIDLKDNVVYRVRAILTTDQSLPNAIPFWSFVYDNFQEQSGFLNFGGERFFVDVAGGAAGIGRPQGRSVFDCWITPNAVTTAQWRTGAFTPSNTPLLSMRIQYRVFDFNPNINADEDFGTICIQGVQIDTFFIGNLSASTLFGPPIDPMTHAYSPESFTQPEGEATIDGNMATLRLISTSPNGFDGNTFIFANGSIEEDLIQVGDVILRNPLKFDPAIWESDTLYSLEVDIRSLSGENDPPDIITLAMDTPTSEQGASDFMTRGPPDGPLDRVGSPSPVSATFRSYWYSHNVTRFIDDRLETANRFRGFLRVFNLDSLFDRPTGGGTIVIDAMRLVRVDVPETPDLFGPCVTP